MKLFKDDIIFYDMVKPLIDSTNEHCQIILNDGCYKLVGVDDTAYRYTLLAIGEINSQKYEIKVRATSMRSIAECLHYAFMNKWRFMFRDNKDEEIEISFRQDEIFKFMIEYELNVAT